MENTAKIEIKIGSIEFSAEGDKDWVAAQLDKVIENSARLAALAPALVPPIGNSAAVRSHSPMGADPAIAEKPLASFLKEKNSTTKQVAKFLATAIWLEARGKNRMSTGDVAKALSDASQSRLGNPSDCLAQNVAKGFCEKDGSDFFVTAEGKASLG